MLMEPCEFSMVTTVNGRRKLLGKPKASTEGTPSQMSGTRSQDRGGM